MNRIPPEVESLIWSIAEAPTEKAVQEFHARYPAHAGELARRIATVRALRGAGKEPPGYRPGFTPRPSAAPPGRSAAWAAGFALAAVAVASFTFAILARRKPEEPAPKPLPVVVRQEAPIPRPAPVELPKVDPEPRYDANVGEGDVPAVGNELPKWRKPTTISLKGIPLVTALRTIASQSGMQIEIDPGMANPTISVSYRDLSALEIFQRMGAEYAFTPYDQGNGTLIIVPAREERPVDSSDPERKRYDNPS